MGEFCCLIRFDTVKHCCFMHHSKKHCGRTSKALDRGLCTHARSLECSSTECPIPQKINKSFIIYFNEVQMLSAMLRIREMLCIQQRSGDSRINFMCESQRLRPHRRVLHVVQSPMIFRFTVMHRSLWLFDFFRAEIITPHVIRPTEGKSQKRRYKSWARIHSQSKCDVLLRISRYHYHDCLALSSFAAEHFCFAFQMRRLNFKFHLFRLTITTAMNPRWRISANCGLFKLRTINSIEYCLRIIDFRFLTTSSPHRQLIETKNASD